jgi:hypothetical protein
MKLNPFGCHPNQDQEYFQARGVPVSAAKTS